jgi:hypothetical protein
MFSEDIGMPGGLVKAQQRNRCRTNAQFLPDWYAGAGAEVLQHAQQPVYGKSRGDQCSR